MLCPVTLRRERMVFAQGLQYIDKFIAILREIILQNISVVIMYFFLASAILVHVPTYIDIIS